MTPWLWEWFFSIQKTVIGSQNWHLCLQFLLRCVFLKWISQEAASYLFFCSLCRRNIIEAVYNRLNPYREEDGVSVRIWDEYGLFSFFLIVYYQICLAATKILLRFFLYLHTSVFWSFKGLRFNRSLLLPNLPLKWKYKPVLHRRECCIQSFTVPVMCCVISSSVYMVSSSWNLHCVSNLQTVTIALLLWWVHCKLPLTASKPCHMVVYYWLTLGFALFPLPLPPQRTALTHHSAFATFIRTGAVLACSEQAVWR